MSTLKTNTIQHLTSGFNNVVQFVDGAGTQNGTLCRAWVNFNGTSTVAIRANFNVNSITDNGTGDYTVNFANSLSDANYAMLGNTNFRSISLTYQRDVNSGGTAPAAGSVRVRTTTDGADYDGVDCAVAIFR